MIGYAKLVSRTSRDLLRGLIFAGALGAFFLLPLYLLSLVFQWNKEVMTNHHRLLAFLIWMAGIWGVIIWRWEWFKKSLGVSKRT